MSAAIETPERPTLREKADQLDSYWECHGDKPEVVAKWAVQDMLELVRLVLEEA